MVQVSVDPFLFEVARGLDRRFTDRQSALKQLADTRRWMGALHALKAFGLARATADDDVRWLPTNKAIRYMKLDRFNLTQAQKKLALRPSFYFMLEILESWSTPEDDLVRQYRVEFGSEHISVFWHGIGSLVGDVADGQSRLIGSGTEGGLVFATLTDEARQAYGDDEFIFAMAGKPSGEFAYRSDEGGSSLLH